MENLRLTEICLNYFCLPAFSADATDQEVLIYIETGIYAFVDYAMVHWVAHLEHVVEGLQAGQLPVTLVDLLLRFFNLHWKTPRKRAKPTKTIARLCEKIKQDDMHKKIKDTMSAMHCLMWTNLSDTASVQTLDLFAVLSRVRTVLQSLVLQPKLQELYGVNIYKCSRIYCKWFHEGFPTIAEQTSHIEKHERSHLCKEQACMYATFGFPTAKELATHVSTAHEPVLAQDEFPAEVPDLDELDGIDETQSDNAMQHLDSVETFSSIGLSEDQTNEQVLSLSPDQGQSGSRQSHAEPDDQGDHALDFATTTSSPSASTSLETPQGQKHRGNFKCTLCPKRFTRVQNLRSHHLTHTGERRFKCTVCDKSFARGHDLSRHEKLHSGQKQFICRGTLGSGEPWGCGRRFARADGLGRHFRTQAGRLCIKPLLDEEAAARERALMEEQQQAQIAAGLVRPPELQQPHLDASGGFLPAALLQQYPALAGIDWSSIPQSAPPEEEV